MISNASDSLPSTLAEYSRSEVVRTFEALVTFDLGHVINRYLRTIIDRLKSNPEANINSFALYIVMMNAVVTFRSSSTTVAIRNAIPAILDKIGEGVSDADIILMAKEFKDQVDWFLQYYADYCTRGKSRVN